MSEQVMLELLVLAAKAAIVLALALAATAMMRKQSAAARHFVLSIGVLCAISLPVLRATVPSWHLPIGHAVEPASTLHFDRPDALTAQAEQAARPISSRFDVGALADSASTGVFDWSSVLVSTWVAGTACVLLALGAGLMRLAWLSSGSVAIGRGPWQDASSDLARTLGLTRVRLLQSRHPSLLVAWGWRHPTVLLPTVAGTWQEDRIRAVLAHELAHLKRRDWPVQIAAELLRAACWFNPLAWIACRRLRRESEHACDDVVLGLGFEVASYANHLVEIARSLGRTTWLPAPAMARPSSLEGRVVAMLNHDLRRRPLSRSARLLTLLLLSLVAVSAASAQSFGTFSGTVLDPTERPVPEVSVILTNERTNSTYKVATDSAGRFEFVGLVPGSYALQAMGLGFAVFEGRITLTAADVQQDLQLEVGTIQETVTITDEPPAAVAASAPPPDGTDSARRQNACQPSTSGGAITPPMKIYNQQPAYPAGAQASGIEGVVSLTGLIGTDGFMRDLRVVGMPPGDLAAAALDAVGQWRFTPTLLNCTPIDTSIQVTLKFGLNR